MDHSADGQLAEAAIGKGRHQPAPWWDGRQVAIRPDVPSAAFDPQDMVLVRNDEERLTAQVRVDRFVEETKRKSSEQLWPQWLWAADIPSGADEDA